MASPEAGPCHNKSEGKDPNPSTPSKEDPDRILDFDGPGDQRNPYNWSPARKWLIAGVSLVGTLVLVQNGTSITVAAHQISEEFNVSDTAEFTNTYWTVTSWTLGGAIAVPIVLSLLEDFGVCVVYLVAYLLFLCFLIPQAVASNYATLVVTRFFAGCFAASLPNTIASMIPDMWSTDAERSLPISIYIFFYVGGTTLGAPAFAPIIQYVGNWRWIFYAQLILYGTLFVPIFFFAKETRGHIILHREARRLRQETGEKIYSATELSPSPILKSLLASCYRPVWLLCTEPVLLACSVWSAFSFGTVFMFTQSTELVFAGLYGFNAWQCAYIQLAVFIGEFLGWIVTQYGTRLYLRSALRNDESPGQPIPEARLYITLLGSFFGITGGMFIYAWTANPAFPWIAPAIGLALVGAGIQIVVSCVADYICDAYAESGFVGSAMSAAASLEYIVSGILPLATQKLYTNLGYPWASTLLGLIALLLSFIPVLFIWKGRELRARSPFMRSGGSSGLQNKDATCPS